jgi:hypothetical protein
MDFKIEERLHHNCPDCEKAAYVAAQVAMERMWAFATYEKVRVGKHNLRTVEHSARVRVTV